MSTPAAGLGQLTQSWRGCHCGGFPPCGWRSPQRGAVGLVHGPGALLLELQPGQM
ncbi:hypothetical protein ACFQ08_02445 [Streptosporangium algeriense]|uniref:Uncharacterized protein n=1 Tax=Streptosporangium algeriense TaxID=1682748 RepID=A0ABW3DKB7_9ACTN